MPYCCQCGTMVGAADIYCAKCGARQAAGASSAYGVPPPPQQDYLSGISPRTASLLCYVPVAGWIAAIVVLASARFRHDTKGPAKKTERHDSHRASHKANRN